MKSKTILTTCLLIVFTFNFISVPLFASSIQNVSIFETQSNLSQHEDFREYFESINGCAVIFNSENRQYHFYGEDMAHTRFSPCSTFKVISALLGLKYGILKDENSTMRYDGTEYPIDLWNENLTLEKAFKCSCVWYFRQVIDAAGIENVKNELEQLPYGNCDVSEWNGSGINSLPELNGFWLNSSLKISPVEQIHVLCKIFNNSRKCGSKEIEVLKKIMLVKETKNSKIYGKTGSDGNGHAWFVGFKENGDGCEYFSIYLNDEEKKDQVSSQKAKEIAFKILEKI